MGDRQTASPPYKIFLSNTLLNNGSRLEMQSIAKTFVANTAPYNKKVLVPSHQRCQYGGGSDRFDPGDSPPASRRDRDRRELTLPPSNPVLNQAIAQGAYVVAFDTTINNPKGAHHQRPWAV